MPDNRDDAVSHSPAGVNPVADQSRTYALVLPCWDYSERTKHQRGYVTCGSYYVDRTEENVPHNAPISQCNQCKPGCVARNSPERLRKPGNILIGKGQGEGGANGRVVVGRLWP